MAYPINSQIKPYQPTLTGTDSGTNNGVPLTGATLQGTNFNPENLKDGIGETAVGKKVFSVDNPAVLLGMMLPIWGGLGYGMSKFNAACADQKNGKKTILEKVGDFGDKIGKNSFFQSSGMDKFREHLSTTKKYINERIIDKNRVLTSMFRTPSKPTNSMVLTMGGGTLTELASDAKTLFEELEKQLKEKGKTFKDVGMDADIIEKIKAKPHSHVQDIIDQCRKAPEGTFVDIKKIGKVPVGKILGRTIYCSEMANKLDALKGLGNPKQTTVLGKILPKAMIRSMEGMTNGTAGGKFAILMQAYFIADAIRLAAKSPDGEKTKSFFENLIYGMSFYLTMPLGIKLMHGAGGLQYIGMKPGAATNPDEKDLKKAIETLKKTGKVEDYRVALNLFNEKSVGKEIGVGKFKIEKTAKDVERFASPDEWKAAQKELKTALKGDVKGFKDIFKGHIKEGLKGLFIKPLKWAGRILTSGLESFRPYISKELAGEKGFWASSKRFFKKFGFNFKNFAGHPIRIGLFMLVIAPPLAKIAVKVFHAIFGRPTKSVLDEGKEEKPKAAQAPSSQPQAQPIQQVSQPVPVETAGESYSGNTNLFNKYGIDASSIAQNNSTATPAPKAQEPPRTYIPSSEGVKIVDTGAQENVDTSDEKVNLALNKSEIAEKMALDVLGGK